MSQLFPSNRDLTDREVVADAAADLRRAEQAGGEAQMAAWARKWAAAAVQALEAAADAAWADDLLGDEF